LCGRTLEGRWEAVSVLPVIVGDGEYIVGAERGTITREGPFSRGTSLHQRFGHRRRGDVKKSGRRSLKEKGGDAERIDT